MRKLTEQESKNIKTLTHYPEWQTYASCLGDFLKSLTDLTSIDMTKDIQAQVLGRLALREEFHSFLTAIDIASRDTKLVDKTYE